MRRPVSDQLLHVPDDVVSSPNAHASAKHIVAHHAQFNGKRLAIYSIV